MNQKQREYLTQRIQGIARSKISNATSEYTTLGDASNDAERWKLIRAGKVKPKKDLEMSKTYSSSWGLRELFDFSDHMDKVDSRKLKRAKAKITREVQRITDLAMLADCDKACGLLAELTAFKVF